MASASPSRPRTFWRHSLARCWAPPSASSRAWAPSVVIGIDGYQIAQNGSAGAALAIAAVGSFIGATIGLVGLMLIAGPVSQAALAFGPPEYFAITVVGLFVLSKISSASVYERIRRSARPLLSRVRMSSWSRL